MDLDDEPKEPKIMAVVASQANNNGTLAEQELPVTVTATSVGHTEIVGGVVLINSIRCVCSQYPPAAVSAGLKTQSSITNQVLKIV